MVRFENVSKYYGEHLAVNKLNLEIEEGEFVCFIGPSGCGKTTSLKMINRLIETSSGNISIRGKSIKKLNEVSMRREIGYVIQQIGLFPNMTISQNIDLVPRLLKWDKAKREKRVRELLQLVGLDPDIYADRYPSLLSGGQQQRIGVLRALAADPPLILMDEPFGALDPITREDLQDELKKLQSELKKTIIFVTHDMDEALKMADRIVLMKDGELVQVASPEELLRKPANDFVASFLGKKRLQKSEAEEMDGSEQIETVNQVMIKNPVTIEPHFGLAESMALMNRKNVDMLLVVDNQKHFLGTVSAEEIDANRRAKNIGELVQNSEVYVCSDSTAKDAFAKMREEKLSYVPVLDAEKRLLGLVTRKSLVYALASVVWGEEE